MTPPRVIVGLSGGVDSAVAALLLQNQGYRVECLFMKNWEEHDPENPCPAEDDYRDALLVCDRLSLPLHTVNFSREYYDRVFSYFLDEYRAGRTPNPDVLCNREIKFNLFLRYALQLGADFIATGHYARIRESNGTYHLLKGRDRAKDQSYFLYLLGQEELAHCLFPLGNRVKGEVRRLAREARLPVADKKDSTGICFIGERKFKPFLQHYLPAQPGEIVTIDGQVAGRHEGLMYYTLGQRRGLGVGGGFGDREAPWYVVDKDLENNRLIIAQGHDHPALFSRELTVTQVHWITGVPPDASDRLQAKIRYRQAEQPCTIHTDQDGRLIVRFETAQFAPAPGQSVVFYRDEECLGGGVIATVKKPVPLSTN
jgi:tRNA-specific 2-thiouridylase